ncbi:HD-GYP domain-containing protein [Deinococcus radiotolerans]|uniref:HD-GYP domain-containing protein n=1 Tax=Deinococcus radiotolerans TaxID=1309407 RepID=A0ABQ2FRE9_9DEIO|nr:HD domain-containing phosphohydrolase [Deinococcus radiotolerans]GGL19337.1 hypothetical protein GCM10010844_42850 [Deinococcus radiotolerans]
MPVLQIAPHAESIAALLSTLNRALHLSSSDQTALHLAALLHDVGKRPLPQALLDKAGPLTPAERQLLKQHPEWALHGVQDSLKLPAPVRSAIAAHHERWDGRGYPRGLQGEEIPLLARIISVCDVYDALPSARPYKPAWSQTDTLAALRRGRGLAFDPVVLDAFLDLR